MGQDLSIGAVATGDRARAEIKLCSFLSPDVTIGWAGCRPIALGLQVLRLQVGWA